MASPEQRVNSKVDSWLARLIDLSRRNRLLYFRETRRSTLHITSPSSGEVFQALYEGSHSYRFWVPEPEGVLAEDDDEAETGLDRATIRQLGLACSDHCPRYAVETGQTNPKELATTLRRMSAKASLDFGERGVRILHLAFGMLSWQEIETREAALSPILLVPVDLSRASRSEPWELSPCDEDIVLNPVLAVKFQRDFGIALPEVPDNWDEETVEGYLAAFARAIGEPSWKVVDDVWLGLFSFHKLPMYQDLDRNRGRLGQHSLISRLAGVEVDAESGPQPVVDPGDLDRSLTPADSFLVVDADSSQLAAVETVKLGTSLVLHGPPGTGKSQTITNVIAEMLAAGKTILFVSEKMAALEVVYQRIESAQLGHFCLELHSHKANRKAVVDELYRTMQQHILPIGGYSTNDLERLRERRDWLNAYVAALHEIRQPLNRSVRSVLADLSGLEEIPYRTVDVDWASVMGSASLDSILRLAARLKAVWHLAIEGAEFPWYGLDTRRQEAPPLQSLRGVLKVASDSLQDTRSFAGQLAEAIGLHSPANLSEVDLALEVSRIFERPIEVRAEWLLGNGGHRLGELLRRARHELETLEAIEAEFATRQGESFLKQAGGHHREALNGVRLLLTDRVGLPVDQDTLVTDVVRSGQWLVRLKDELPAIRKASEEFAATCGINSRRFTLRDAEACLTLAKLMQEPERPPVSWLTQEGLDEARTRLGQLRTDLLEAQGRLDRLSGSVEEVAEAAEWVRYLLGVLPQLQEEAIALADALGLSRQGVSLRDTRSLVVLADLCGSPPLPTPEWLDAAKFAAAEGALPQIQASIEQVRGLFSALSADFPCALLSLDAVTMSERFGRSHHNPLAFLRAEHRADLKAVRALANRRLTKEEIARALSTAASAQGLLRETDELGGTVLGRWYQGVETDFAMVSQAIEKARQIRRAAESFEVTAEFGRIVSGESSITPTGTASREFLRSVLTTLTNSAAEAGLGGMQRVVLPSSPRPSGASGGTVNTPIVDLSLDDLRQALKALFGLSGSLLGCVEAIRATASSITKHQVPRQQAAAGSVSLDSVISVLIEANNLLRHLRDLDLRGEQLLGTRYGGLNTDFSSSEAALSVANELMLVLRGRICPERLAKMVSGEISEQDALRAPTEFLQHVFGDLLDQAAEAGLPDVRRISPDGTGGLWDMHLELLGKWSDEVCTRLRKHLSALEELYHLGQATSLQTVAQLDADVAAVAEWQRLKSSLGQIEDELSNLCTDAYQGPDSDWEYLLAASQWASELTSVFEQRGNAIPESVVVKAVSAHHQRIPATTIHTLSEAVGTLRQSLEQLSGCFQDNSGGAECEAMGDAQFDDLQDRLTYMSERLTDLEDYFDLCRIRADLADAGLVSLADALWESPPDAALLVECVRTSLLRAWLEGEIAREPRLRDFRAEEHERVIAEFRHLDRRHWQLGAARIIEEARSRHSDSGYVPAGSERDVLLREANKKRRHLPVRRLFEKIPNLLVELKPCLLMSPLSVSQFLSSDTRFDLVIFDEASQICSEDAAGAIYRGKQVLVCGDQKQLPPTDFFQKTFDEDDDAEPGEDENGLEVYESVLDECLANGLRGSWLRWHYRSRHEGLIAFSNDRFYDYRLVTFPASRERDDWLGVHLVHVPDGIYDRGGRRTNTQEARKVVDLVLDHLQRHPEKSLGVVSFSMAQTQAIEDELDARAGEDAMVDNVISRARQDGFFVKNLENVQGDERDVVVFSIGYGRDHMGRLTMNFGPLNQGGGERRLNVAVTRARERVVLVSSIRASDIDPVQTLAPGVRHLHTYLDFAERGVEALEMATERGSRDFESPLERDVAEAIRQMGYEVEAQVGCSGFRLDLGVKVPGRPGQFILGVECDGATYHSTHTARDRDRLRQEVLEKLGWRIHRVWSPAWIRRREAETAKLRQALVDAEREAGDVSISGDPSDEEAEHDTTQVDQITIEVPEPQRDNVPSWASSYVACRLPRHVSYWHEFHDPACTEEHADRIVDVVRAEGPVHIELVARRLADAWGLQRVGSRMRQAIELACRMAVRRGLVERRGEILWPTIDGFEVEVRVPTADDPSSHRKLEHVPPEEISLAMVRICRDGSGVETDALVTETARLFGLQRTGRIACDIVTFILDKMVTAGVLLENGGRVLAP